MAVQTLADLRSRVKDWANRKDISDSLIDDFINVAQARANRILRIPVLEGVTTLPIDTDGNVTIPADYVEARELKVESNGVVYTLERREIHFVDEEQSKQDGIPTFFARKFNQFILAPKPDNVTEVSLYYYISLPSLVEDTQTSWFVTDAPEMLLYGALVELFLYVKNPAAAGQWEAKYRAALDEIQSMANEAEFSGKTLQVR